MTTTSNTDSDKTDTEESLTKLHEPTTFFKPDWTRRTGLWHDRSSPTRIIPWIRELEPLDPNAVYTIAGIVPNEEAIALIDQESERLTKLRYGPHGSMDGDMVRFGRSLTESYISMIEKILKRRKIQHIQYDLVNGGWDYSWATRRYPTVFVMKGTKPLDERFDNVITSLHDEKVHEALLEAEKPQNYEKGPIETLYQENILPFVKSKDITAHLSGRELKIFVDLLLPWKIEKPHDCRNTIYVD